MQITNIPLKSLTQAHWQAWTEIQRSNADLNSPHFSPQYVQCVAEHRDRLECAILSARGHALGFFPYYRNTRNIGEPIAASFSELQGFIGPSDLDFDPRAMLRACGLRRLSFTELLASQVSLQDFHSVLGHCPFMDLSGGFEAYRLERRASGSDELQQTMRKARKVQREVAPLRFESISHDPAALTTLLEWKQRQLHERKLVNPFAPTWPKELMNRLLDFQSDEFSGMLSLLFFGDDLAAAMMGFRAGPILNIWVTSYDPKFQRYSPGLILLSELAQAAPSLGLTRIDLGRGNEPYKRSFASGGIEVAQGTVERTRFAYLLRNAGFQAREWVRATPFGQPARKVVQRCRYAFAQWTSAR